MGNQKEEQEKREENESFQQEMEVLGTVRTGREVP